MAKKKKARDPDVYHVIQLDVFNQSVVLFDNADKACQYVQENSAEPKPEPLGDGALGLAIHFTEAATNAKQFVMVICDGACVGTLAHEASHLADMLCDHLGIPIDMQNTEVRAHVVGHIVRTVMATPGAIGHWEK